MSVVCEKCPGILLYCRQLSRFSVSPMEFVGWEGMYVAVSGKLARWLHIF